MKAYIQTKDTTYTIDNADRLSVNLPFVEIQKRSGDGPGFETVALIEASKVVMVGLGEQPKVADTALLVSASSNGGHHKNRHSKHDRQEQAVEVREE